MKQSALFGFKLYLATTLAVGGLACDPPGREGSRAASLADRMVGALATADRVARAGAIVAVLDATNEEDLDEVLEAAQRDVLTLGPADARIIVSRWARSRPREAFETVSEWRFPDPRKAGLDELFYTMGLAGDAALAKLLLAEAYVDEQPDYGVALARGWARSGDVAGVTQFIADTPSARPADMLAMAVAGELWIEGGADRLIAWAEGVIADPPPNEIPVGNPSIEKNIFRKALRQISIREPVRASEWYAEHVDAPYAENASNIVASEWIERDPEIAMTWLLENDHSSNRTFALRRTADRWMRRDLSGAIDWLDRQEDPEIVSVVAEVGVLKLAPRDPTAALELAERVVDEAVRDRLKADVGVRWIRRDPIAARAWLNEVDLAPELEERVRKSAARQRERGPG